MVKERQREVVSHVLDFNRIGQGFRGSQWHRFTPHDYVQAPEGAASGPRMESAARCFPRAISRPRPGASSFPFHTHEWRSRLERGASAGLNPGAARGERDGSGSDYAHRSVATGTSADGRIHDDLRDMGSLVQRSHLTDDQLRAARERLIEHQKRAEETLAAVREALNAFEAAGRVPEDVVVSILLTLRDLDEPTYSIRNGFYPGWLVVLGTIRRWRMLALTLPSLWTTVDLDLGSRWATHFLARSGAAPISLVQRSVFPSADVSRLAVAVIESASGRIKRLELDSILRFTAGSHPDAVRIWDCLANGKMPALAWLDADVLHEVPGSLRFHALPVLNGLSTNERVLFNAGIGRSWFADALCELAIRPGFLTEGERRAIDLGPLLDWLLQGGMQGMRSLSLTGGVFTALGKLIKGRRLHADRLECLDIDEATCPDALPLLRAFRVPERGIHRVALFLRIDDLARDREIVSEILRLSELATSVRISTLGLVHVASTNSVRLYACRNGCPTPLQSEDMRSGRVCHLETGLDLTIASARPSVLLAPSGVLEFLREVILELDLSHLRNIYVEEVELRCEDWVTWFRSARELNALTLRYPENTAPSILTALGRSPSRPDREAVLREDVLFPALARLNVFELYFGRRLRKQTSKMLRARVRADAIPSVLAMMDCKSHVVPGEWETRADKELQVITEMVKSVPLESRTSWRLGFA